MAALKLCKQCIHCYVLPSGGVATFYCKEPECVTPTTGEPSSALHAREPGQPCGPYGDKWVLNPTPPPI